MAYSMTGYGKSAVQTDKFSIDVEIKTVNNRYLDIHTKLPSILNFAEATVNKTVKEKLKRGRCDISIYFKKLNSGNSLTINKDALKHLYEEFKAFQEESGYDVQIPMESFIRLDGVVEKNIEELDEDEINEYLEKTLDEAIEKLLKMRLSEGKRLVNNIEEKLNEIEVNLIKTAKRAPELVEEEHQRLRKNIEKLLEGIETVDENIIANEIALYAQKADIDEEIIRLGSHIEEFRKVLKTDDAIGKTLDFIVQEMNREVNTMSSKSNDTILTNICVSQKTIIEQVREQIQNLE